MTTSPSHTTNDDLETRYDEHLMPVWKRLDVPVKRAHNCTLEDFDGNTYLDLMSGIAVANVGHSNPAVVEAAKRQLEEFVHGCSYRHPNEPVAALAERIAEITPGDLEKTFFCNSGTEAVEGAIKLARKHTGNRAIVALELSFHGRTLGSLALTGNAAYKRGMGPTTDEVIHVKPPYAYRCQSCESSCTDICLEEIPRAIETRTSGEVAAIVVEPVLGEGGILVPPEGWLARLKEIAHEYGGLLVVDEIQTGYGRTGELFAAERFGVVPDIMPQAKGIANGLPLGAFSAPAGIADSFEPGDHLSTFGGNPVSCAAALATIDELTDGLVENAREQGEWLSGELAALESEFEAVGECRGLGLLYGIELVESDRDSEDSTPQPDAKLADTVAAELREEGVIVGVGGFYDTVVRIQPPLTITRSQLERSVKAIRGSLKRNL